MAKASRILLLSFLVWVVVPSSHAYATIGVTCQEFNKVQGSNSAPETICAVAEIYGPSPAQMEDGTVVYVGGYSWSYDILDLTGTTPEEVLADQAGGIMDLQTTGTTIVITHGQDDNSSTYNTCNITVNGQECDFCAVCGPTIPTSINVDCSNVEGGRTSTVCEPVVEVFYPFEGYFPIPPELDILDDDNNATSLGNSTASPGDPEDNTMDPAFRPPVNSFFVSAILLLALPISNHLLL